MASEEAVRLVYYKARPKADPEILAEIPMMSYRDKRRHDAILERRMPGLYKAHYLAGIRYPERWESTAPRPDQRRLVLSDGTNCNLILFGRQSGTGKTCAGLERIWSYHTGFRGYFDQCLDLDNEDAWPLWISGVTFAARCSRMAADNRLEEFIDDLCSPSWLLIDDADKRGSADGTLSPTVQQAWLELIERRTNESNGECGSILTLNADGPAFAIKFGEDYREYLMRRLATRFEAIDFDPPHLDGIEFTSDWDRIDAWEHAQARQTQEAHP